MPVFLTPPHCPEVSNPSSESSHHRRSDVQQHRFMTTKMDLTICNKRDQLMICLVTFFNQKFLVPRMDVFLYIAFVYFFKGVGFPLDEPYIHTV